jgi:ABC-type arginine/histidine transport system permease subunit
MSPLTILRRVKFPIALRILFPAYTNEVVFILQSTSLASLVTVMDLTGAARVVIARTFAPYEMFITIGIIYLVLTYLTLWGFRGIEGHLYRHLRSRKEVVSEVPVLR